MGDKFKCFMVEQVEIWILSYFRDGEQIAGLSFEFTVTSGWKKKVNFCFK